MIAVAGGEASPGHDCDRILLDGPSRRRRPSLHRPDPCAGQQVSRLCRLSRPPAEGAVPCHGQGQDRPGALPHRTAPRVDNRPEADRETAPSQAGSGVELLPPCRHCQGIAVAIDHFSRRVMGIAGFDKQPSSVEIRAFLGRVARAAGTAPKYLISDHGKRFTDEGFAKWCERRGIRQRFGAVGK